LNHPATPADYPLSLHDALPICVNGGNTISFGYDNDSLLTSSGAETITRSAQNGLITGTTLGAVTDTRGYSTFGELSTYSATVNKDRKSTRLNSSHVSISYAVFC